jgi:hypothetical protein
VGFACACDYVAKIASSRFPGEKNRPRTPQSARVDDGISAPVQKIPPCSTSEPPPPHRTTHSSSLTLPTCCLLGTSPRGRARTPENRLQDKSMHQIDNQIDKQPKKSKSEMKAKQLARTKAWHDAWTNKAKGGAAAALSLSSSSFYAGMTTTTTTPQLSVVHPPLSTSQFAVGDKRKDSKSDRRKWDEGHRPFLFSC